MNHGKSECLLTALQATTAGGIIELSFCPLRYVPLDANDPKDAYLLRVGGRQNHFFPPQRVSAVLYAYHDRMFFQLINSDPTWTNFQAFEWSASIIHFFELLQEEYDGIFHERKLRTSNLLFN